MGGHHVLLRERSAAWSQLVLLSAAFLLEVHTVR